MSRFAAIARRRWRLFAGLALLGLLLVAVDPRAVLRATAGADPAWLALALASAVAANAVSALRWWAMARWLGGRVGPAWALARYFGGVALNAVLPGAVVGGDVYRAHALVRTGMAWGSAGVSVLVDRVGGLWVLVAMGLVGAGVGLAGGSTGAAAPGTFGVAASWRPVLAVVLPAVAGAMLLGPAIWLAAGRARRVPAAGGAAPGGSAPPIASPADRPRSWRRALDGAAALRRRPGAGSQLALQLALSAVVQAGSIATLACAGGALGVTLPAWAWVAAAVPIFVMATLPVSFGGWGSREAATIAALALFGVPAPLALGIGLFYGLAALAQAVPGALLLGAERGGAAVRESGGDGA